jgi:hypothetical protein
MEWTYNNKPVKTVPDDAIGFIYLITNQKTSQKYIGKKLLTKRVTRVTKGKKRKERVDSDWRDYYSSSPDLQAEVAKHGKDNFSREILTFCPSKGSLLYAEELALYLAGALERDDFYNQNIRSKVYRNWIFGKLDTSELRKKVKKVAR